MHIAIVEDDMAQAEIVQLWLEAAGHEVSAFADGASLIPVLEKTLIDCLILDWELPDVSGIELLSWARRKIGWELPILFTTVRRSEGDIVAALEAGADDYLVKPLSSSILLARIGSITRRVQRTSAKQIFQIGHCRVDRNRRQITCDGQTMTLTPQEYELAVYLLDHSGSVLSREAILKSLWNLDTKISTRTVDTHISRIRRKLALTAKNGWLLEAVYGYGYRIEYMGVDKHSPGPA